MDCVSCDESVSPEMDELATEVSVTETVEFVLDQPAVIVEPVASDDSDD